MTTQNSNISSSDKTHALVDMHRSLQALYELHTVTPVDDPNYHLLGLITADCKESFEDLAKAFT